MTTKKQSEKATALYHRMYATEGFDETAVILLKLIREAQKTNPGKDRILFLDIDGHRNSEGGLDKDAFELVNQFGMTMLLPYLVEFSHPLARVRNPDPQRNQVPEYLSISAAKPAAEGGGLAQEKMVTNSELPAGSVFLGITKDD